MKYRTESALQKAIVSALESRSHWVIRTGVTKKRSGRGTQSGEPGIPDLFLASVNAWLEIKLPGRTLSPDQQRWHAHAKSVGIRVWTVDSVEEALDMAECWRIESRIDRRVLWRVAREREIARRKAA
jgi:hypothetical protein